MFISDFKRDLDGANFEIKQMRHDLNELEKENAELRKDNAELKKSLKRYRAHVGELNKTNANSLRHIMKNIETGDETPASRLGQRKYQSKDLKKSLFRENTNSLSKVEGLSFAEETQAVQKRGALSGGQIDLLNTLLQQLCSKQTLMELLSHAK